MMIKVNKIEYLFRVGPQAGKCFRQNNGNKGEWAHRNDPQGNGILR